MKKFSIRIWNSLNVWYSYYLSDKFIKGERFYDYFKEKYPLWYSSRRFDKPAEKWRGGTCSWRLDNKCHREDKPAIIWSNEDVEYYENEEKVK